MRNTLLFTMSLSIALQFMAAFMAIRLIRQSGVFTAWLFLACGFIIQAVRRVISLNHVLVDRSQGDLPVEVLGLVISACMLCGICRFRPLFSEIKHSEEVMRDKQDELRVINQKLEDEIAERQMIEESLKESEERYRAIAEYSHDWESWIDADGSFRYVSPYCKDVSGYDREEFYRDPHLLQNIIHPDDRETYLQHFHQAFSHQNHAEPVDFRIITREGEERWIGHVCRPVFDSQGRPNGRRTSHRDITDRKRIEHELHDLNAGLEERVTLRTEELARLNRELQSFCYSISHELRAPLARLEAFSAVLKECVADARPDELTHIAERIGVASIRLKEVIDALLQMNRISRVDLDRESVDLSKMARSIMNDLLENAGDRTLRVSIEPGLVAQGDRSLLEICLRNLLANGVKYTAKSDDALLEVGQFRQDDGPVYFVRDNGVGFDMAFAGKLFKPFCRLHAESEFEGNGIGLSTVQLIIERHGGRIWAEAAPNRGATFYFTLGA